MKKVAVILSGCGVNDGAEIHESVLTMLALDRRGAQIVCAAPNVAQAGVVDHLAGKETGEKRNVLVESARIARGQIVDLAKLGAKDVDAAILPGGYGAAKNLSTFAAGAAGGGDWTVDKDVERFLTEMHRAKKPLGFLCIAPAIAAKVFGKEKVTLTIGTDRGTAQRLEKAGARHEACTVEDVVVDHAHKVVTTPAYMLAKRISEAAAGIDKLVGAVLEMA
jgi:enhancing lycopene biosynthesis protein 2